MAIDMSQFYQVFFDESAEHLASMESFALSMNPRRPTVNRSTRSSARHIR